MKSILVVEDSRAEQQLIVSLLQNAGHHVQFASSAEEAWEWLKKSPAKPDMIVLDIIMPGATGLDFCRELRQSSEFDSIPVIFCSSKDKEFDQFWALRQGGNAYITKPFAPNEFMTTVQQYLH
ncbi:PleD family two-component system response regulator [Synechococcus sp. PCC 7336]|uniref:response regulator n=1 Tax=Synechococcus sp. PCC 7336 TaxID=195250 RepID=UPI0003490A70|nr:response regulator [Synechococcus sp. PCC 7336]